MPRAGSKRKAKALAPSAAEGCTDGGGAHGGAQERETARGLDPAVVKELMNRNRKGEIPVFLHPGEGSTFYQNSVPSSQPMGKAVSVHYKSVDLLAQDPRTTSARGL